MQKVHTHCPEPSSNPSVNCRAPFVARRRRQFCCNDIADPWIQKSNRKNMLLMLLSFPVRAVVGGRMASFSLAAYTRAIYHLDRPLAAARSFTISLSLVTHHKRLVTCRNITAVSNSANGLLRHREIMRRTCPALVRAGMAQVGGWGFQDKE